MFPVLAWTVVTVRIAINLFPEDISTVVHGVKKCFDIFTIVTPAGIGSQRSVIEYTRDLLYLSFY